LLRLGPNVASLANNQRYVKLTALLNRLISIGKARQDNV
jgi:hypothetical protein